MRVRDSKVHMTIIAVLMLGNAIGITMAIIKYWL